MGFSTFFVNFTIDMRFFFIFLFTCFSLPSFAQFNTSTIRPEARQLYQQAIQKGLQKDYQSARNLLFKALKEDSIFIDARNELAEVYRQMGMIDSSIHYYQTSLEKYPRGLDAHQKLAAAYQLKGDDDTAINQYQELLRHFPNYPQAYYGMALINYNRRHFEESIRGSEMALRLFNASKNNSNAADARMLAGQAYMKMGSYDVAIKYFKASKKHFEAKPFYHYYIGFCYLRTGKKDKANQYLSQAELMGYKVPKYVKEELASL